METAVTALRRSVAFGTGGLGNLLKVAVEVRQSCLFEPVGGGVPAALAWKCRGVFPPGCGLGNGDVALAAVGGQQMGHVVVTRERAVTACRSGVLAVGEPVDDCACELALLIPAFFNGVALQAVTGSGGERPFVKTKALAQGGQAQRVSNILQDVFQP